MDAAQRQQFGLARSMEEIVMAPSNSTNNSIHIRPAAAPPPQQQLQQQQQQEQVLVDPQRRGASAAAAAAAATRPHKEQNLNCPRCNSTNTKFCYYNNYSLTQPRYFCKTCRRYWTQGGSLRNVPVGGGSRKNKRSSSSTSSVTNPTSSILPSSTTSSPAALTSASSLNPSLAHLINISTSTVPHNNSKMNIHPHHLHGQDLNLAFPSTTSTPPPSSQDYTSLFQHMELLPNKNANDDQNHRNLRSKLADHQLGNVVTSPSSTTSNNANSNPLSALELLRTGMASSGLSSYVPITMSLDSASNTHHQALYAASGFPNLQEFKPNLMGSSSFLQATTAGDHHQSTLDGVNMGRFQLHHGVDQENSTTTGSAATEGGGGGTNARLLFPFGDINSKIPNGSTGSAGNNNVNTPINEVVDDQSHTKGQSGHPGYWNGILGGGTSW